MKTTNFEAETWFQRPETPSRVLEPLGTKINFAAYHRSDAMVAKKVEYRSGSQIWRYRCFASDGLCRLSGVALGFQTPPPPHRWPLEAVMASRHLQAPESGSQHSRKLWTHKTLNGLWRSRRASRASRHLRAPREESGGHQGSRRASRHHMGRARLPCATRHPDVLQKATRSSNTAKPLILYTYD